MLIRLEHIEKLCGVLNSFAPHKSISIVCVALEIYFVV